MTIPVSEFKVDSNAHIHHVRIQRDSLRAVHVSRPATYIEKNGEYHSYTISLGGHLTRNEPMVVQEDEEVDFTLDGLVLIDGDQIADTHSIMDHRFSHGNSHQLHKVVVKGNAHSIFNGKIFVRKDAQKIDSFQENRNLLLSANGLVNTKPQLEIFADDVLCSHGATIGQLDPEHVFYLQSRGMTEQKAKEVLTYAFALETIENIKVDSVHKLLIDEVKRYTTSETNQGSLSMKEAVHTMAKTIDFNRIRLRDFPVLTREINGHPLVYLDNAASSQMPRQVADRLDHYHRLEHANVHRGIHTLSQQATDAYEATRKKDQRGLSMP
jgi:FeS assembly protein SufD